VNAHFSWWRTIWEAQVKRVGAESDAVLWSEPEFGPPPYLQTLPYTSQPVADLWDVNKRIAARARIEFESALKAASAPEGEAAAAAGGEAAAPKQVWVPQLGGGYVLKDAPGGGGGGAGGPATAGGTGLEGMSKLGGSLLDLATKDAVKEEREKLALKKKHAEVKREAGINAGKLQAVPGPAWSPVKLESPDGDVELLALAMSAMNAPVGTDADGTALGGSAHVCKILFSPSEEQLAIVGYVPAEKAQAVNLGAWVAKVLEAVGGTAMCSKPMAAVSPKGGFVVQAALATGEEMTEDKSMDLALAAANAYFAKLPLNYA